MQPLVTTQLEAALGRSASVAVAELTDAGIKLRRVTTEQELAGLVEAGHYRVLLTDPDMNISKYVTDQAIGRPETPEATGVTITGAREVHVHHTHVDR